MATSTRSPTSDAAPKTVAELERTRTEARQRLREAVDDVRAEAKKSGAAKLTDGELEIEILAARADRRTKR